MERGGQNEKTSSKIRNMITSKTSKNEEPKETNRRSKEQGSKWRFIKRGKVYAGKIGLKGAVSVSGTRWENKGQEKSEGGIQGEKN